MLVFTHDWQLSPHFDWGPFRNLPAGEAGEAGGPPDRGPLQDKLR